MRWRLGDELQRNDKAQRRASFGAARDRWVLLGEQQCQCGLAKWRTVRGSVLWTQQVDSCVRWIAGRGCSQQEESWAAPVFLAEAAPDTGDDIIAGVLDTVVRATSKVIESRPKPHDSSPMPWVISLLSASSNELFPDTSIVCSTS